MGLNKRSNDRKRGHSHQSWFVACTRNRCAAIESDSGTLPSCYDNSGACYLLDLLENHGSSLVDTAVDSEGEQICALALWFLW